MATNNLTNLQQRLTDLDASSICTSEGQKFSVYTQARNVITTSDCTDDEQRAILTALHSASNPSGHYHSSNGIRGALAAIQQLIDASSPEPQENGSDAATDGFTLRNLRNLVADGRIFVVEFVKRTTGETRRMRCRTGVKKHLRGGKRGYDAKAANLLPVFDMDARGYRSIPVDGILSVTIGGQRFNVGGAI